MESKIVVLDPVLLLLMKTIKSIKLQLNNQFG